MSLQPIIAHLDMDAFYASAERIRRPDLAGLPVAIGGRSVIEPLPGNPYPVLSQYEGRGVLTTANYEARQLGLHSAMPTMKAAKLAPHAVLLPADFDWYKLKSRQFKQAVREIAPLVEDRGIDEIYIDLTALSAGDFESARQTASLLKTAVLEATGGMTCSIGLSANKLTSKICSDLQKPNGLTVVRPHEFQSIIWPLAVGKINGIGPKASQKLQLLNIHTVGHLAAAEVSMLQEHFGHQYALWLHRAAHGLDERKLETQSIPKSMSRETTFEINLHPKLHRTRLSESFTLLCNKVAEDLQRKGYLGRNIGLKLRFDNFDTVTRAMTLNHPTSDPGEIRLAAGQCLKRVKLERSIRLLGVRIGALEAARELPEPVQRSLF